ncbi:beta-xylosidase/alpha-L-arabinofuranosidase 2-like [Olea europaea var. sylvestris]|uniref:beta-xylosidase/alpha-L-arabinofuranosidase 2-like n=1 Tax=Olea europaea var. sylvestris TaxID=158386 RepID=UPI000C1D45F3|nr:beta-xylosidase/alpha-L-arabinofuranosidase 2-like [Olea europaea var. sylvestris]
MAKISFLLCSILVLLAISEARNAPSIATINDSPSNLTKIYTKICDPQRFNDLGLDMDYFTYCDSSLSYGVRVKDLIDRMTLMEKVQQIGDTAYGVPRIGLAKYEWWSEALHGVSKVGQLNSKATFFDDVVPGATSFPCPITTTASFNQTLWKTIGQVVSTEARAMYNLGHAGLTFWSPNINVVRDPRWGRTLETPGEDPFVVGTYAANYVRGLQDIEGLESTDDPNSRPVKVAACCKHYAAYDVDSWLGVDRTTYDALVTEQDMLETFQKPFEMCVKEGDVMSVMCSFNRINGIPACADQKLLKDTLRGEWDLHGYIVSDCDSIEVMVDNQKWLHDEPEDAVSQAMKAGLDLDCGNYYTNYADKAVMQGKISEKDIDEALKNLYIVLMRLGFFDGSSKYESLGKQDVCSDENIELATQAAREGMVLLKNLNGTLPLNTDEIKTIAVVGPHANATTAMIGNYEGIPCKYTSPIDGFSKYAEVQYAMGCGDIMCKNASLIFPAMQAAKNADATVIVAGIDLNFLYAEIFMCLLSLRVGGITNYESLMSMNITHIYICIGVCVESAIWAEEVDKHVLGVSLLRKVCVESAIWAEEVDKHVLGVSLLWKCLSQVSFPVVKFLFTSIVIYLILVGVVRMYIAVTQRKHRKVKEVGKFKMNVGAIAFYQLMQVRQAEYFRQLLKPVT